MEFVTMGGNTLNDEDFDRMGEAYESGEWPEGVTVANVEPRQVSVTPPGWVTDTADREAARLCVPRRSVLNMWLASCADAANGRRATVTA